MKLNIEVGDADNFSGRVTYFHSVVIDDTITKDQFHGLLECLEAEPDITTILSPVYPGDDIYGIEADHYATFFYATRDMTTWLNEAAVEVSQ